MAVFDGEVQNGLTKRKNSSRRKNSTTTKRKRRNGTTKAGALSFAKKNGLKLVSKTVANGHKKKHHRRKKRNGITTVSARKRNGIFGNTKHDATQVVSLLGGMGVTKIGGGIIGNFVSPYVSQLGAGNYGGLIGELAMALLVVPMITKKISPSSVQNARLGGLAVVGLSLVEKFGGTTLAGLNPFNSNPIVMGGGGAAIAPGAVAQLVNNTSATPQEKAQVAGAMRALASGVPVNSMRGARRAAMPISPLYD